MTKRADQSNSRFNPQCTSKIQEHRRRSRSKRREPRYKAERRVDYKRQRWRGKRRSSRLSRPKPFLPPIAHPFIHPSTSQQPTNLIMRIQPLRLIARLPVQRPFLAPSLFPSAIRMSSSSASSASTSTFISAGEDVPTVQRAVESLIANGWGLDDEKMGIKKTYYFKGYFKAVVSFSLSSTGRQVNNGRPIETNDNGSSEFPEHDCG